MSWNKLYSVAVAAAVLLGIWAVAAQNRAGDSQPSGSSSTSSGESTFTLKLNILDKLTHEPLKGRVSLDGQLLAADVSELERELPLLDTSGDPLCMHRHPDDPTSCLGVRRIEVRVTGYEPWVLVFRAKLKAGRVFGGPVLMKRSVS